MQLARADGELDDREMRFIFDMGKMMGMASSEIELPVSESEHKDIVPPSTEPERLLMFYRLLFLIKIDNKISKEEETFLHKIAHKLGVRDTLVVDMIRLMRENLMNNVPADAMLNKIRHYLN